LQSAAAAGSPGARAALELKAEPARLLATVQIGLTIIAVLSGTYGEATLRDMLQGHLAEYSGFVGGYAHVLRMAVVVLGISYVFLILGELVPKRVALINPERIASVAARFMQAMAAIGAPIEWFLSASSNLVLKLLPMRAEEVPITDEEIAFMLREGA